MVSQMLTLNLLLIPIISVGLINKTTAKNIKFSLCVLVQYVLSCVFNVILCKVVIIFLRSFGINILPDSGYYTILSTIIAVIISIVYLICKKIFILNIEVSFNATEE